MSQMSPEEDLLVAICRQAAADYLEAYDMAGICRLKGDQKKADLWNCRFLEAESFFLGGNCREVVNADDAQILRGLRADLGRMRNWERFETWDEAVAAWREYAEANGIRSSSPKTEKKQMRAWLIRKCD